MSEPLTEKQKIEILRRNAAGETIFEIKKGMKISNGQQISGVLSSQYTETGRYLLKKAGLSNPTKPPHKMRKDLVKEMDDVADAERGEFEQAMVNLDRRHEIESKELEIKHLKERHGLLEKLRKAR